jgi:flavodoxin
MGKRCLVAYTSYTGHTEKIALKIKETFDDHQWHCDLFKVRKNADDILRPPYDLRSYDFICAGSGLRAHLPYNEILNMLRGVRTGFDPRNTLRFRDENIPYINEPTPPIPAQRNPKVDHHRIILNQDSPRAMVFITYAGYEFGPKEAEPAVQLLALEMEHIGFQFVGSFRCPGVYLDAPMTLTFHGDIRNRPDENDMANVRIFVEEKLKEINESP